MIIVKLLFVCTANVNRSKTGELLYREMHETLSAGLFCEDTEATTLINKNIMDWADVIVVFEDEHIEEFKKRFPESFNSLKIINLQIPDIYQFNSETLIDRIEWKLNYCLKQLPHMNKNIMAYSELNRAED